MDSGAPRASQGSGAGRDGGAVQDVLAAHVAVQLDGDAVLTQGLDGVDVAGDERPLWSVSPVWTCKPDICGASPTRLSLGIVRMWMFMKAKLGQGRAVWLRRQPQGRR